MKEMRGFSSHVGVPRRRGSGAEGCAAPSSLPRPLPPWVQEASALPPGGTNLIQA